MDGRGPCHITTMHNALIITGQVVACRGARKDMPGQEQQGVFDLQAIQHWGTVQSVDMGIMVVVSEAPEKNIVEDDEG